MDTRQLVVGQEVHMMSGPYGDRGKVVKVTPEGVEVSTRESSMVNWIRTPSGLMEEILHFNTNGKGRDDEGTYECGRWELVDMPFEVGTPKPEQASDQRERTKSKEKL